jgi:hypothetical protein
MISSTSPTITKQLAVWGKWLYNFNPNSSIATNSPPSPSSSVSSPSPYPSTPAARSSRSDSWGSHPQILPHPAATCSAPYPSARTSRWLVLGCSFCQLSGLFLDKSCGACVCSQGVSLQVACTRVGGYISPFVVLIGTEAG